MIGSVPWRPMTVPVPVVPREDAIEQVAEVRLGPRSQFHQGQAGCGVGGEDVDQPVATALAELRNLGCQIGDAPDSGRGAAGRGALSKCVRSLAPSGEANGPPPSRV